MLEIKFSGRGGQGVVVASQMLGMTFFRMNMYPQCYSLFGGERRGAPVVSFLRVDREKILLKCNIQNPNELIVFDVSLADPNEVRSSMPLGSKVLVSSHLAPEVLSDLAGYEVGFIDAQAIAESLGLGHVINTAILGAYCGFTGNVPVEVLMETIQEMAPYKQEENIQAAKQGYDNLKFLTITEKP